MTIPTGPAPGASTRAYDTAVRAQALDAAVRLAAAMAANPTINPIDMYDLGTSVLGTAERFEAYLGGREVES